MSTTHRPTLPGLVWAVLACAVGLVGCSPGPRPESGSDTVTAPGTAQQRVPVETPAPEKAPVAEGIRVAAVGDIMLGTDYPEDRLPEDGGVSLLTPFLEELQGADVAFGNFEGVLLDGGEPEKQCRSKACYAFRTPSRYVQHLQAAGFDALSLANNHARDFGDAGRQTTIRVLDDAGIRHSGPVGDVARWEVKGRSVAMVAFSPFAGSYSMHDLPAAARTVREIAFDHDIVIVSVHGGAEGDEYLRIPFAREEFHGENRGDVVAFARTVVDAGADLVLGHGPHVPRAVELYRGRLIAYSLGNFCTYWGIKVSGYNGLAPILVADLGADGEFRGGRIVSAVQKRPFGPLPDPDQQAARLIRLLTEIDFPATPLRIGESGELWIQDPADPSIAALGP